MGDSLTTAINHLNNNSLAVSKELSKTSKIDITSIFIIVSFVALLFILLLAFYKIITWIQQGQREDNQKLRVELESSTQTFWELLDEMQKALKDFNKGCMNRNLAVKQVVDSSVSHIDVSIRNLYNTLNELIEESASTMPVFLALGVFNYIMKAHCLEKANILYDRCKFGSGNPDEVLNIVSHEFRKITEEEKSLLDKIIYKNNHTLGEELEFILRKENWDNFINTNVSFLVKKYLGKNPNHTDLREETVAMFTDLINPMKENIRKKGGLSCQEKK